MAASGGIVFTSYPLLDEAGCTQSGIAGSEVGSIRRFKVITSLNVHARSLNPARLRMSSRPSRSHIWCPTYTGPASRVPTSTVAGTSKWESGRSAASARAGMFQTGITTQ